MSRPPPKIWKMGERCRIRYEGRVVEATIAMSSPNGVSLALSFEALLVGPRGEGYMGFMPIMWIQGRWLDLFQMGEIEFLPSRPTH